MADFNPEEYLERTLKEVKEDNERGESRRSRSGRDGSRGRDDRDRDYDRRGRDRDGHDRRDRHDRDRRDRHDDRRDERRPKRYRSRTPDREDGGDRRKDRKEEGEKDLDPITRKLLKEQEEAERDDRTVFVTQIALKVRTRELYEFFSENVGKVNDVKIIKDSRGKSKGVAYVEFDDKESVVPAIACSGSLIQSIPIIVQDSQAEKNRLAAQQKLMMEASASTGPTKLYVGNLHHNMGEDELREMFAVFGEVESSNIVRESSTNQSKGYGFVNYYRSEHAKEAMQELNGLEVGGRAIKVSSVSDGSAAGGASGGGAVGDLDEEGGGLQMSAASRAMLMQRLASSEGTKGSASADQGASTSISAPGPTPGGAIQATECLVLRNMFDPKELNAEGENSWREIGEDVKEECSKYGSVHHVYVDRNSYGNIYIRLDNPAAASAANKSLNGRWFGGRQISVSYVDPAKYSREIEDL